MARKPRDSSLDVGRLSAGAEADFTARFYAVVGAIHDRYTLSQLADLIERGRIGEALALVEKAAQQLGLAWARTYGSAGTAGAGAVNRSLGAIHFAFDQTNARAIQAIRQNQLRLVREFSTEQRRATAQALQAGVRAGANPIEQARTFRESIGLTSYQERAVANYRAALEAGSRDALSRELRDRRFDRTVASAADSGEALSGSQIDAMVERYRERYIKYRAETIARTEAMQAANEGANEAMRQAVETGDVSADRVTRQWIATEDNRTRDSHSEMDGQEVDGVDEPFTSGDGYKLRYPGDPAAPAAERINCRCRVTTRIAAAPDAGPVRISVFEQA